MIIPVVLVCVVIMSLLGTVLMSSSQAEYSQSALVGYGLRARELALAALEEARAHVYDNLHDPAGPRPWHKKLFDACKARENERGVLLREDIKAALERTRGLARAAGGELMAAEVEFLGFRPVHFISNDLFRSSEPYYATSEGNLDATRPPPPREYNGYYRVRVQCRFGKVARVFSELHDVKIVSVVPPARKFALFANMPTITETGQLAQGVTQDYLHEDLNRGAGFRVHGNGVGRIFVRGPFVVRTEGWTGGNGRGRGKPEMGNAGYDDERWHGWRTVPATRDGIVGNVAVFFTRPPRRPEKTYNKRSRFGAILGGLAGGLGDALFTSDPGWNILEGQRWYCESMDRNDRSFGILGDHRTPEGRSRFLGVVTVQSAARRTVAPVDSTRTFGFSGNGLWGSPGNRETRWVIEPEGGLLGIYNTVQLRRWSRRFRTYYELNQRGSALARFGVHWEKEYKDSWFRAFVAQLFEVGSFVMFGSGLGFLPPIPALIPILPNVVLLGPQALALGTVGAAIGAELLRPDNFRRIGSLTPANARGIFPPGYRLVRRSLTRMYPSLEDIPSSRLNRELKLDGVIGFENMTLGRGFRYRGRGYMYSDNPDVPPVIDGAISNANVGNSWLTMHYDGPAETAASGTRMVTLGGSMTGSVYSTQGVKPKPGTPILINGNLTVGFLNKFRIEAKTRVNYHAGQLARGDAEYDDGSWHVCAISHRATQVYDK